VALANVLKIDIDLTKRFQHHKELPRANDKKKDYQTRQLMYFYTMILDPTDSDTTLLFFNYFDRKAKAWEKFQVHALKIDASNYGSHGNMDESATESVSIPLIRSLTSIDEIVESSWEAAEQLKKEQEQTATKINKHLPQIGEQIVDGSQFSLPSEVANVSRVRSLRSTQATSAAHNDSQGPGFSSSPTPTKNHLENIINSTLPVGDSRRSGLARFAHSIETIPVAIPNRGRTRPASAANSGVNQPDANGFNDKENRMLAAKSNCKAIVSSLPLPSRRKPLSSVEPTSNIVRQA